VRGSRCVYIKHRKAAFFADSDPQTRKIGLMINLLQLDLLTKWRGSKFAQLGSDIHEFTLGLPLRFERDTIFAVF